MFDSLELKQFNTIFWASLVGYFCLCQNFLFLNQLATLCGSLKLLQSLVISTAATAFATNSPPPPNRLTERTLTRPLAFISFSFSQRNVIDHETRNLSVSELMIWILGSGTLSDSGPILYCFCYNCPDLSGPFYSYKRSNSKLIKLFKELFRNGTSFNVKFWEFWTAVIKCTKIPIFDFQKCPWVEFGRFLQGILWGRFKTVIFLQILLLLLPRWNLWITKIGR